MYVYIYISICIWLHSKGTRGGFSLLDTQQFSANRQPKKTKNLSLRMVKYNHIHGAFINLRF